jgi:GNAT superfamily N-acetyltransferase
MEVRARVPGDLDPCLALIRAVKALDDYPPRGPIDVDHFLAPPQELAAWVAVVDGAVVGHVALHDTGFDVTMVCAARHAGRPPSELALVARLVVGPAARRGGVARALLDTAAADAHDRGRRPVLDVATQLHAAVALYESRRWERAGEVMIAVDGEPSLPCYVYVGPDLAPPWLTTP